MSLGNRPGPQELNGGSAPAQTQPSPEWLDGLTTAAGIQENHNHYWSKDPSKLTTTSHLESYTVGTGLSLYTTQLLPALSAAQQEIILVTCFWAPSPSLNDLSHTLLHLSAQSLSRAPNTPKLRVRLCLSSRSVLQKLLHTSSPSGYTYPPSTWASKLGIPPPSSLRGLDLQIKSVFILPFSVMHPKFVIIDRRRALLPSCNLSHEIWLEGCLSLTGHIVPALVDFWRSAWGRNVLPSLPSLTPLPPEPLPTTPTILLPSPHHRSPRFRPLLSPPLPPATPLNTYLLHLLATSTAPLTLLTPNLTSPPLLPSLLSFLSRGNPLTIITNRRMMTLEQLLTAGTTTELFVHRLIRAYKKLFASSKQQRHPEVEEEGRPQVGKLRIAYYRCIQEGGPTKCHIKCTVVEGQVAVLGSGNMDRASWFTSQELGITILGHEAVTEVWATIEKELEGRLEEYFGY
ncbi:hypothetical protein MMC12_004013 [Toensbergia leucococca]|nr:hypothetical protein [Toensbergia leucococca]